MHLFGFIYEDGRQLSGLYHVLYPIRSPIEYQKFVRSSLFNFPQSLPSYVEEILNYCWCATNMSRHKAVTCVCFVVCSSSGTNVTSLAGRHRKLSVSFEDVNSTLYIVKLIGAVNRAATFSVSSNSHICTAVYEHKHRDFLALFIHIYIVL